MCVFKNLSQLELKDIPIIFLNYKSKFKPIKIICHKNKNLRQFINLLTASFSRGRRFVIIFNTDIISEISSGSRKERSPIDFDSYCQLSRVAT